jgi:hypothetical protein
MRTLSAWSHAVIDYVVVILLVTGPSIAGFAGRQATFAYLLAALLFVLTIFTRSPLGVVKRVRFAVHGAVELILALLLLLLPWIANFSRGVHSRNFYVAMALLMLIVWAITDFRGVRGRAQVSSRAERGNGVGG